MNRNRGPLRSLSDLPPRSLMVARPVLRPWQSGCDHQLTSRSEVHLTLGQFRSTYLIWTITSPHLQWLGSLTQVTISTWKGRWGSDIQRDRAMG